MAAFSMKHQGDAVPGAGPQYTLWYRDERNQRSALDDLTTGIRHGELAELLTGCERCDERLVTEHRACLQRARLAAGNRRVHIVRHADGGELTRGLVDVRLQHRLVGALQANGLVEGVAVAEQRRARLLARLDARGTHHNRH